MARETITIIVEDGLNKQELTTYTHEYSNVMQLLKDNLALDGFGECGGMGRCGTCLIKIPDSQGLLPDLDRNEQATILKMGITDPGVRLSCQILVDKCLDGCSMAIVAQDY